MPSIRGLITFALSFTALACVPPQVQAQKLSENANDLVTAARFGRMDIVLDSVNPTTREAYSDAHSDWGGRIRILDMEYGGARMLGNDSAVVVVNVQWQRIDESILRGTALKQKWVRLENNRWMIDEETVAGGHKGLIREPDPKLDGTTAPDQSASTKDESLPGASVDRSLMQDGELGVGSDSFGAF